MADALRRWAGEVPQAENAPGAADEVCQESLLLLRLRKIELLQNHIVRMNLHEAPPFTVKYFFLSSS